MLIEDSASCCTMRFSSSSPLSSKEFEAAEGILQKAIADDRPVRAETFESTEAASAALGTLLRPSDAQAVIRGRARAIIIEGVDANACGGTHVSRMGEVGEIEIQDIGKTESGLTFVRFGLRSGVS